MMPAAVRWKRFDAEVLFLNPNDAARGIAALIDAASGSSRLLSVNPFDNDDQDRLGYVARKSPIASGRAVSRGRR
jgi:hypothetical protein